ncbi:MAG: cytochrome c [Acidobacteriota bacterium]
MNVPRFRLALGAFLLLSGCASEPPDRGRELYRTSCAPCHGLEADGKGPRAAVLDPKPRDYTDPAWRETATFESVLASIRDGVPGTSMPSWEILTQEDLEAVTRYVLEISAGSVQRRSDSGLPSQGEP